MSDTLGSLRAEILLELRGDLIAQEDQALVNAKINNALENLWMSMMQAALSRFLGLDSPVTFTLPAGAERVQLVSIPDPTVAPVISGFVAGALPARTILGCYTYVTESGSETQASPTTAFLVPLNSLGQVAAPAPVSQAFGWNFYASPSNTQALLALQNQQPLPFVVPYQEPPTGWLDYPTDQQMPPIPGIASGPTPAGSPPPSENSTADNISWIKHLEIRTSDTVLRSWNQNDLDSAVMRAAAGTVSSASEYQNYAWDLINGNRLEIRPAAGLAFQPRYFYIAKPRRLRYDQAEIPYVSIAGVHEFLCNRAVSQLKLALDEYASSTGYKTEAEGNRRLVLTSLTTESWAKNMRIQPHLY